MTVAKLHLEKAGETKVSNCLSSNNLSFQGMLAAATAIYLQPARGYSNTPGFLPRVGLEVFCSVVFELQHFHPHSCAGSWCFSCWIRSRDVGAAGSLWPHIPGTGQPWECPAVPLQPHTPTSWSVQTHRLRGAAWPKASSAPAQLLLSPQLLSHPLLKSSKFPLASTTAGAVCLSVSRLWPFQQTPWPAIKQ